MAPEQAIAALIGLGLLETAMIIDINETRWRAYALFAFVVLDLIVWALAR
jgi:hypothetical protein